VKSTKMEKKLKVLENNNYTVRNRSQQRKRPVAKRIKRTS